MLSLFNWFANLPLLRVLWWAASGGLMSLALFGIVINWAALVHNLLAVKRGWRHCSSVHFLPGAAGLLGMLACPIAAIRYYAWVPLLLDLTIPMEVLLPVVEQLRRRRDDTPE